MVSLSQGLALVSEIDSRLGVTIDLVALDLREGAPAARDTTPLVVLNLVATDERSGVK